MVTVATFNEPSKAEPLRQKLETSGIHAEIFDESKYEWFWFVTKPLAGIRLKVPKKDFEKARQAIRAWDGAEGVLRDAVRCPQCGDSRIEYPQFTRKFLLPNLVGVASLLHIIDKEYYCQDCEFMWPKDLKPPWPKKHGSPDYFIEGVPPGGLGSAAHAQKQRGIADAPASASRNAS